jgi:hypothetical protein
MVGFFYIKCHTRARFFAIFCGLAETSATEIYYQQGLPTNVDAVATNISACAA